MTEKANEIPAVICKRSLLFVEPPKPGQKPSDARRFLLQASPAPQPVPDWLLDFPAFVRAIETGELRALKLMKGEL